MHDLGSNVATTLASISATAMPIMAAFGVGIAFVVLSIIFLSPSQPSPGSATGKVEHIDMTIADLKSTYRPGEPIIFSVKAKGVSLLDIACNGESPRVGIRDDGSGGEEKINLTPIIFKTALQCIEPVTFDKEWTFGDEPGEEIALDKAGSYTVVASYEDILVEEKFAIAG